MARKRNYQWTAATRFEGSITQDKVGGSTQSVTPEIVEARLIEDGFVLDTDLPAPSSAAPQDLGTTNSGSSNNYSRADHRHKMPTLTDIGAVALGETSTTAYRGDRGKAAYDHSQASGNPHSTTAAQVGAEPALGTPPVTSFLRSTAAGVRAWVQLVAADITNLATVLTAYLTKNNPDFTGTLKQSGSDRITAGGGFRGIDAKFVGAGSDTFGSGTGVMFSDAAVGYSNACGVQMSPTGGLDFWTWTGSAWRKNWGVTYLGTLRNSAFAGGGTRPLYTNGSGDTTVTPPAAVITKAASYDFTGITADIIAHATDDVVATLSNGVPGRKYTLLCETGNLGVYVPSGVAVRATSGIWNGPTSIVLGGDRPIMIQCMSATKWLIPNYGE